MFGLATPPELMAAAQLLVAMCGKMPALRSELLVIFGAIDRGEGVDIGGIADAGLRDRLRAVFETLKDGSTAFVLKPGSRLKLRLSDLLEGGDAKKDEREKKAAKDKKRREKYTSSYAGAGWGDFDVWGETTYGKSGTGGKSFKQYINEYTITMDIKLLQEPPRDGMALFQTALVHAKENKERKLWRMSIWNRQMSISSSSEPLNAIAVSRISCTMTSKIVDTWSDSSYPCFSRFAVTICPMIRSRNLMILWMRRVPPRLISK